MVAGQQNNLKIGVIIQARMQSSRLPDKVMIPLPFYSGKPIIGYIIEQLRNLPYTIVVATSGQSENDQIATYCKSLGINCHRGDEENVLSRFIDIQKIYKFGQIFRFTADNPFVDNETMEYLLEWHLQNNHDYSVTKGLPIGMNLELINGEALINSAAKVKSKFDTEHVTPVLKRNRSFVSREYDTGYELSHLRLTVDTALDLIIANAFADISEEYQIKGMALINYILENRPYLIEINKDIFQKNSATRSVTEIENAVKVLRKLEYYNAANKLAKLI